MHRLLPFFFFLALFLFFGIATANPFFLKNTTFIDNGDVCKLLIDDTFLPDTTCTRFAVSGNLSIQLASCAEDDFIEIELAANFEESGPLIFPNVKKITLFSPTGGAKILGASHVVIGNETALEFVNVTFNGNGTTSLLFDPPLRSNSLNMTLSRIENFHGEYAVLIEGCEPEVRLLFRQSVCFDVWGACFFAAGLASYEFINNTFARCGGLNNSCVFLKDGWHTLERQIFFQNQCWLLFNELAPRCLQCIDPPCHVRCNEGVAECEDLTTTELAGDCPKSVVTYQHPVTNETVMEEVFDRFCRRYRPCVCEPVLFVDAENRTMSDIVLNVGDIVYPSIILQCVPGSETVGGGAAEPFRAIIRDRSLEFQKTFHFWDEEFGGSEQRTILTGSDFVKKPAAFKGESRMICEEGDVRSISQLIDLPGNGTYRIGIWMARLDNMRDRFGEALLELYIGDVLVGVIADPVFHDMLTADNTYFEVFFPAFTAQAAINIKFELRCNFAGVTKNVILAIDNIHSPLVGLELTTGTSAFPPGLGIGPPIDEDPLDFIAIPLTSDATIAVPPCDSCPTEPARPPEIPCDYTVQQNFSCVEIIDGGTAFCVTPELFNIGAGVALLDPSFENATSFWNQSFSMPIQNEGSTPQNARTGDFLMLCADGTFGDVSQDVTFPGGPTALYKLEFWGRRRSGQRFDFDGKFVRMLVDDQVEATIVNPVFEDTLLGNGNYFRFEFPSVAIDSGLHTITLVCDMRGGSNTADLQIDDVQFVGAFAPPTTSPTPSTSASSTPTPSASQAPVNATPSASQTPTNVTLPPDFTLRCVEGTIFLGHDVYTGPCILPRDFEVINDNGTFTAEDCILTGVCTVPDAYDVVVNGFLLMCVSASAKMMTCDCSTATLLDKLVNRTIAPNMACYELDKVPNTVAGFFFRENDAVQHEFGLITRRIESATITTSSIDVLDYFDRRSVGRELEKQDTRLFGFTLDENGFKIRKRRILMDALPEYETECVDGCPIFNPVFPGTTVVCIVDNAASDLSNVIYATIQSALDDVNCTKDGAVILVQNSENFYEENLKFEADEIRLFSRDNATVLGVHEVLGDVNLLFSRGLAWVHGGRNGQPLFDIDDAGDLRNLTLLNNEFIGAGVKDAGIIRNRKRLIRNVEFSYNKIKSFQTTSLRVSAETILINNNLYEECSGRLMQVRYAKSFEVQHNVLNNSRGAKEIQKPALIELRYIGVRGSEACSVQDICLLRNNVQIEADPERGEDYKETGILLIHGAIWAQNIRDNVIIKARTGLRLRRVNIFVLPDDLFSLDLVNGFLVLFQFYNPLVRPTRTRSESGGEDFMVDGFFNGERIGQQRCSFPDCTLETLRPKRCIANLNFDPLQSRQYGWETFTNLTQAAFFCSLNLAEVTIFGGGRLNPERLRIRRPLSDALVFPLRDTTTIKQIIDGKRPMPSTFFIEGRQVDIDGGDVSFFASLLDRNITYGFGRFVPIFNGTKLECECPGTLLGDPIQFKVDDCTELVPRDVCAEDVVLPTNATLINCTQGSLVCVATGEDGAASFFVKFDEHNCSVSATFFFLLDTGNGTTVVQETVVVEELDTFPLHQCDIEVEDIFLPRYDDSTVNLCERPAYYSVGHTYRALNISWQDIDFYLHYGRELEFDELEADILRTEEPSADTTLRRVGFFGLEVEAPGPIAAARIDIGLVDPDIFLGRKEENRRNAVTARMLVDNCTFADFLFFETILNNTGASDDEFNEVFQFPYINGLIVTYHNTLPDDNTRFTLQNSLFSDIDRRVLDVRFANQTFILNNTGIHVGGRSVDSTTAFWIEGNVFSLNAEIVLRFNNFTQTRIVTFPFLGELVIPAYTTMIWLTGLHEMIEDLCAKENLTLDQCENSTSLRCCPRLEICNNFFCGLPIGVRIVGRVEAFTQWIANGLPASQLPIGFEDRRAAVREIAFCNSANIDGTYCDIVHGEPQNDFREEHICCRETCPPTNPRNCRVNSTDVRIRQGHPYEGVYWYRDPNLCLEFCQASSRECLLEQTSDLRPYDVRLNASVTEPPVFQYRGLYTSRVTVTVLATSPFNATSPPQSLPIILEDSTSVQPIFFSIIPGVLEQNTSSIVVSAALQLPSGIPPLTPTLTPAGWTADIDILFTFCAPNITLELPQTILFNLSYTSPPITVSTFSNTYTAFVMLNWTWVNAIAKLDNANGMTLTGVGEPVIRCDGHSLRGPFITVRDLTLLHANPCNVSLGPDCPCLPDLQPGSIVTNTSQVDIEHSPFVFGLATWHQNDSDIAQHLKLSRVKFDGDENTHLAIDGHYHVQFRVEQSTFSRYAKKDPGYVVRIIGSHLDGCCGPKPNNCSSMKVILDANEFLGEKGDFMPGNVILVRDVTSYSIKENKFENVCCKEDTHPLYSAVHVEICSDAPGPVDFRRNRITRTDSGTFNDRVTPNNCYWTAYTLDQFPSGGITVEDNMQFLTGSGNGRGAAVCMRVLGWPVPIPSIDCRSPLRDLMLDGHNQLCDGVLFDIVRTACVEDVCIAAEKNCFGKNGDTACQNAKVDADCKGFQCFFCNDGCYSGILPLWTMILIYIGSALLVLLSLVFLLTCITYYCCMDFTFKYDMRMGQFVPADPGFWGFVTGLVNSSTPPIRSRTSAVANKTPVEQAEMSMPLPIGNPITATGIRNRKLKNTATLTETLASFVKNE